MSAVGVTDTIRNALSLCRETLPVLARRVLPVLALAQAIELLPLSGSFLLLLVLGLASWLGVAWAGAYSLRVLLGARFHTTVVSPSATSLALFLLVGAYVTLTATLGALLFVLPALLVIAAASLAPIFALQHHCGPFEAVALSTDCTKGSLLSVAAVLVLAWLAIVLASTLLGSAAAIAGPVTVLVTYVASVAAAFVGLFHYAVVVVLFERLHPNPPLQGTPAGPPAAPLS